MGVWGEALLWLSFLGPCFFNSLAVIKRHLSPHLTPEQPTSSAIWLPATPLDPQAPPPPLVNGWQAVGGGVLRQWCGFVAEGPSSSVSAWTMPPLSSQTLSSKS